MTTPELQQARTELTRSVNGLGAALMPFDALEYYVSLEPKESFNSSLLEPFMGNLDPSEFSKKEQDRYLDEMRSIQEWQGGKAGDWDEDKSLWVILSADLIPRGSGQEDGASLNLVLQGYSEAHQAWTSLRMYANIVQSRLSGHSDEGELIGAQLLSDSDPTECLVVPTLAQTVALSGIVHEACRIVQTGK